MPNALNRGDLGQPPAKTAQYVYGSPAATPVLRPLRQPLYDTEKVGPAGTTLAKITLFTDRKKFSDGTAKNEAYTNMPGDGVLATPLEFDLIGFIGNSAYGIELEDWNKIYNGGVFKWIFSQSVVWLTTKLTHIPQGIGPRGSTTETSASILSHGDGLVNNFFNFTDHKKKARKIVSNESFKNEIDYPGAGTLSAQTYWTTTMLGLLYAAL